HIQFQIVSNAFALSNRQNLVSTIVNSKFNNCIFTFQQLYFLLLIYMESKKANIKKIKTKGAFPQRTGARSIKIRKKTRDCQG
ncbi:hypothetical protein, partial [Parabacteroides sp. AM08-6]|uniref:hypothetical protein n=1 Tax=Parabacteroides sp. AM08-6 TaxID=2292053 RepID=UPI001F26974C